MKPKPPKINKDYSLSKLTTFKIGGPAKCYIVVKTLFELRYALNYASKKKLPIQVIGNGSNILASDRGFNGVVIRISLKGIDINKKNTKSIYINVSSGEQWQNIITYAVDNNLWGIENLSGIPGSFGGLVVQNAGAYGQEIGQVITSVKTLSLNTNKIHTFTNSDCKFAYRSSIFNSSHKNKYIVLSAVIKLSRNPSVCLDYPILKEEFGNCDNVKLEDIRKLIITTRNNRIPNWHESPNSGSFFKNVEIRKPYFNNILKKFKKNFSKDIIFRLKEYQNKFSFKGNIKIPTAFLIEICNLSEEKYKKAKLAKTSPLVIINTGNASSKDVMSLFKKIRQTIYHQTGLEVKPEVTLIGFSKAELKNYFAIK